MNEFCCCRSKSISPDLLFAEQFHEQCLALKSPKMMNCVCDAVRHCMSCVKCTEYFGQYATAMRVGVLLTTISMVAFSMNRVLYEEQCLCVIVLRTAIATPP